MVTRAARRADADGPVDHSDRCADRRRVIHCDPPAAARRANRSPGWCLPACSNTLSSTDFTRRRRRDDAARDAPPDIRGRQVAWPRLRSAGKRRASSRSRSSAAIARRRRQEGDRPRRARPAEGRRVHRLLRDLLGHATRGRSARSPTASWRRSPTTASSRRTSKATTDPNGFCSTTSTSSCTSSRRRRALFYGLERLWGNAERIEIAAATSRLQSMRSRLCIAVCDAASAARSLDALSLPSSSRPPAPPAAQLLEHPTRGPVCERCWRSILPLTPPLCDRCGDPLPPGATISVPLARCAALPARRAALVDRARAIGAYDGALRAIVHALKYDGRRSLARPLGALMRARGADVLDGADVRRSGAAPPVAAPRARVQSGGRSRAAPRPRRSCRRCAASARRRRRPACRRRSGTRNVRGAFAVDAAPRAAGTARSSCWSTM